MVRLASVGRSLTGDLFASNRGVYHEPKAPARRGPSLSALVLDLLREVGRPVSPTALQLLLARRGHSTRYSHLHLTIRRLHQRGLIVRRFTPGRTAALYQHSIASR